VKDTFIMDVRLKDGTAEPVLGLTPIECHTRAKRLYGAYTVLSVQTTKEFVLEMSK